MGKIAFVFPGQGAQAVGMGKEFYETYGVKEGDGMYLAPEDRVVIW